MVLASANRPHTFKSATSSSSGEIMDMPRRLGAEFFGTFWLTFAGCGSAVLAAGFPSLGQLWLFWLAPILGASIAGVISRWQHGEPDA
jgi:glycerol uptake facilitator-like aquaporin